MTKSKVLRKGVKGVRPAKLTKPEIIEMRTQKMAVVVSKGDPNVAAKKVLPTLFGSVYKLKFELKKKDVQFKVGRLRARWPDAHLAPKGQWTGIWALPVPEEVTEVPQKAPEPKVRLENWEYGTVAQMLHIGPYRTEHETVMRLRQFIKDNGYEIAGSHEEEYLTSPKAKVQRTLIRYPVKKV